MEIRLNNFGFRIFFINSKWFHAFQGFVNIQSMYGNRYESLKSDISSSLFVQTKKKNVEE